MILHIAGKHFYRNILAGADFLEWGQMVLDFQIEQEKYFSMQRSVV